MLWDNLFTRQEEEKISPMKPSMTVKPDRSSNFFPLKKTKIKKLKIGYRYTLNCRLPKVIALFTCVISDFNLSLGI